MSRESEVWNDFLTDLQLKLSTYEIQKDKNKYNVADINHWGESGHEQGIEITTNNIESFIKKTARYNVKGHEYVKNLTITESQLAELNHILSITLIHQANISSPTQYEIMITGDYIKISDFIDETGRILNRANYIKSVKVFCLNTIFVDRDIDLSSQKVNINIISPKWEIINAKVLDLSGGEGGSWSILNGKRTDGKDGEPGYPGDPGGNFVGIGAKFVNGKNLRIISNGGNGGAGVDGNDGENGVDGYLGFLLDEKFVCERSWCENGWMPTRWGDYYECEKLHYSYHHPMDTYCEYRMIGSRGTPGETGGHGGKGGSGGYPGTIELFELNGSSGILRHMKPGNNGKNGAGGKGGKSGADRLGVNVRYLSDMGWLVGDIGSNERVRSSNGIDGGNLRGMLNPETLKAPKKIAILKEYKNYLRENLKDRSKRHELMEFLQQLDNDDTFKGLYDTPELFNELKDIEEQFYTLDDKDDLVPIYQSLLNRISEYALNPRDIENSNEHKIILMNLYTATLGKISYLLERSKSNLIIDMDAYLDLIMKDIKNLKDLQVACDKVNLINNYKENYKKNIDQQIEEARYAVQRQIIPEIENAHVRIDEQIDILIYETQALEDQAKNEVKYLVEKRDELKQAMKWKLLCNVLKFVGQAVGFFGPIGSAMTSWVGSIKGRSKSSNIDDRIDHRQNLRSDVQRYTAQLETDKTKKRNKFNEMLNDVNKKINENPEKFKELAAKIDDMKRRLSKNNAMTYGQVQKMEDEFGDVLKNVQGDLTGSSKNVTSVGKLDKDETMKQAVKLYKFGHDIYDKYKDDEDKVNAIIAAIEQTNEEIWELEEYEKNIHDEMTPMLQNMEDHLRNIANDLNDESQVFLDVTRWQVQSFLKDVKKKLTKMTENFKDTNDELSYCVDMLEDTMTTLINVYDRIQDYQREQKFADFVADVSLIAGSNVAITDPKIREITNGNALEKLIRSNYVIMRLKTGIEAFKSFVFPMAHVYLKNTILPSQFQLENNFDEFLTKSTQQMIHVKSAVDTYKMYLNGAGYDPNIKLAPFKSQYTSTRPFFTWPNSQYKETIGKLLSGHRVTVTADIKNSPVYKDAIKFSVAEFFFNAQNKTMQSELNEVLKGFEVEAWHRGDSHYRCNDKIYRLNSNVTSISYYFEKGADGEPVSKSLTYVKLAKSESILSPYATWEVILTATGGSFTFPDLDKYKDVVDLELMGYGSYIDNRRIDYSKLMVDDYYQPIKMYKGLNSKNQTTDGTSNNRQVRSAAHWPNDHSETSHEANFINKTISKVKNLRAIRSIANWFGGKSIKVDKEISAEVDSSSDVRDLFKFNTESARNIFFDDNAKLSSNRFIDNDNHSISNVDYNSLHSQANLLLFDLVIRKTNRNKYKNVERARRDDAITKNAQYLAYSAYAPPGNEQINNTTHSFAS